MGKNLKGKECGKGISQRKDGLYCARFVDKCGKRREKYFSALPEARNWLDTARQAAKGESVSVSADMTVDTWFNYWINYIVGDLALNTRLNYRERYEHNIQSVIGGMKLTSVKPLHCKMVLNQMNEQCAGSTIRQAYITVGTMFKSALMNDLIAKHPMDGVRYTKPVRAANDIKYLTVEEQRKFLETATRSHNYNQYALILETGLRTGEMIGLMTVTFTSCTMRRKLSVYVCMLCVIRTQQGRLKKEHRLKCCKDFSDTRAYRQLWTDIFT